MQWCLPATIGQKTIEYLRRSASLSENWYIIVAFALILTMWISLYYWEKLRKRPSGHTDHRTALFLELCQAHQLTETERALASTAAASSGLHQHALLFVDPNLLGSLADSSHPDAPSYGKLLQRLFGDGVASGLEH